MASSIIETGLRADVMRKRIEDKNTLQHKGSLYVGKGTFSSTDIDGVIFKTYETAEFYPVSDAEFDLPIVADSNSDLGVKFSKINGAIALNDGIISTDLITRRTINHEDLSLYNFPVSFLGSGNIISSSSSIVLNGIRFSITQLSDLSNEDVRKKFYISTNGGKWNNARRATTARYLTSTTLVGSDQRWRYPSDKWIYSYIQRPFSRCVRQWTTANVLIYGGESNQWTSPFYVKYLRNVLKVGMILSTSPDFNDSSHNFDVGCWPGAASGDVWASYTACNGKYRIPIRFSVDDSGKLVIGVDNNQTPYEYGGGGTPSAISYVALKGVAIVYAWNVVPDN